MTNNTFHHPRLAALIFGSLLCACFEDTGPINNDGVGDDGTGGSDTGGGDEPTQCWCATVEGAMVDPPMGPSELVVDNANNNGSPKACLGADSDVHAELAQIASNNLAVVGAGQSTATITFRDDAFNAAETHCDTLADAQGGTGSTNDCNSVLIAGTSPLEYDIGRTCTTDTANVPPDDWSDYYRLASVIALNSATGAYEIDAGFYDDVLQNPGWLANDSAYIALNSSSDFAFFNVNSGDLLYALGIRSGDVPETLNSYSVTSLSEVAIAYAALWDETSFDLVVTKPVGGQVTLSYEIVP